MGIGLAFIGTILVIFVAMLFRSRFSGASHRGSGPSGNSHCEKPNSMMLSAGITSATNNTGTSATGNNTSTTNNSSRMVGGYRPIPQSKNEADANPDIIPDANSFSTGKQGNFIHINFIYTYHQLEVSFVLVGYQIARQMILMIALQPSKLHEIDSYFLKMLTLPYSTNPEANLGQ